MIFIRKIPQGTILQKKEEELWFFFCSHHPVMLYICTKIHENIFDSIKVMQRAKFSYENFKGA